MREEWEDSECCLTPMRSPSRPRPGNADIGSYRLHVDAVLAVY